MSFFDIFLRAHILNVIFPPWYSDLIKKEPRYNIKYDYF